MERLGHDARRLLAAAGLPGSAELSAIVEAWGGCVGEIIAAAAWPSRVARDGTLHVATASSTWAFELGLLSGEILERLHVALGDETPSSLRFAAGLVPAASGESERDQGAEPVEITPQSRAQGAEIAAQIEDEELRLLVARAAAASLERARTDRRFC
jgi:predicted nucleic acid-binding Zn ribbon protein